MSFGWSVGDIVSSIELGAKLIRALDDATGSASKYQQTREFLDHLISFQRTLSPAVESDSIGQPERIIYELQKSMKKQVDALVAMIEPYHEALQDHSKVNKARRILKKMQWYFKSEEVGKLQDAIQRYNMLLDTWLSSLSRDTQNQVLNQIQKLDTTVHEKTKDLAEKCDIHYASVMLNSNLTNLQRKHTIAMQDRAQVLEEGHQEILKQILNLKESLDTPREARPPLQSQTFTSSSYNQVTSSEVSLVPSKYNMPSNINTCLNIMTWRGSLRPPDGIDLSLDDTWRPGVTICRKLKNWWGSDFKSFLWIKESPHLRISKNVTAVRLAAHTSRIPIVYCSFHIPLDTQETKPGKLQLLVWILYSMIDQLGIIILNANNVKWDLPLAMFEQLDGTAGSIPAALTVICNLIRLIRGRQIIILSGFETLDDNNDIILSEHISALLEILRRPEEPLGLNIIKTLIFTAGPGPTILAETLKKNEKVDLTGPPDRGSYLPLVLPYQSQEVSIRPEVLY